MDPPGLGNESLFPVTLSLPGRGSLVSATSWSWTGPERHTCVSLIQTEVGLDARYQNLTVGFNGPRDGGMKAAKSTCARMTRESIGRIATAVEVWERLLLLLLILLLLLLLLLQLV